MIKKRIALVVKQAINANGWDSFIYLPKLAVIPSFFGYIGEAFGVWYIENEKFIFWIFMALILDHILGTIVHWFYLKNFSFKKNIVGLLTKLGVVATSYLVLEGLHNVLTPIEWVEEYFAVLIQVSLLLYPGLSAMKNIHIISDGKYPPAWFFKNTEEFNETGNLGVFKTTKKDQTNFNIYEEQDEQEEI